MYRQGDILIVKMPQLPPQRKGLETRIVAHGELTGHNHRIEGEAQLYADDRNNLWIHAQQPFDLVHDEHDAIHIPEGVYYVIRQREYDEGEIRYVRD